MRLNKTLQSLLAFAIAAILSVFGALAAGALIERASIAGVQHELARDGLDWATVDANGLQVFLAGNAPDEALRFKAVTAAGRAVDAARVLDQMTVADSEGLRAPRFSIELLRNDAGLSLIGLVPTATDVEELLARIQKQAGSDVPVSNFLETADFAVPDGWDDALDFAVSTLDDLPRSKISVAAGEVQVTAMTTSEPEKRRLETDLTRRAPKDLRIVLRLTAPRPVITPFTLRFVIGEDGTRFDACSAGSEDGRARILKAAVQAGLAGKAECRIGLGVPSNSWPDAVETAIAALAELGGGSVTFSDADVSLIAREGTDQALFDKVVGALENDLPDVFALTAVLPETTETQPEGPPQFAATLSPEGAVQLRGRIGSESARNSAESYAKARFGSGDVTMAARIDPALPSGWSNRVLTGLEALARLASGSVMVMPDSITLIGKTGNKDARDDIAGLLSERLGDGQDYKIVVEYDERLDPTLGIPTPEECEAKLGVIIAARKITFEPSSATLDASAKDVMDEIAELLKKCGAIPLEVQGHTDSQGREIMNQELSQARAEAVLEALRMRRILTSSYTARGYGESQPIADNGTEEGREANRRIEFRLFVPGAEETLPDEATELESDEQAGQDPNTDQMPDPGEPTDPANSDEPLDSLEEHSE